jgi:predicted phosphoribosyltransferase
MFHLFKDRHAAGKALAHALAQYNGRKDVLVLALPRGGVPVGYEVAKALSLPLDVWLVRKLGVPGHEELAMGAIAIGEMYYINRDLARRLHISDDAINQVIAKERSELARRDKLYRQGRPVPDFKDKIVILIDDGLATGASMKASIESLRHEHAGDIVVAVPVGAVDTVFMLEQIADDIICLQTPEPFYGVGMWYEDFSQTSDEEVQELLANQPWVKAFEETS